MSWGSWKRSQIGNANALSLAPRIIHVNEVIGYPTVAGSPHHSFQAGPGVNPPRASALHAKSHVVQSVILSWRVHIRDHETL